LIRAPTETATRRPCKSSCSPSGTSVVAVSAATAPHDAQDVLCSRRRCSNFNSSFLARVRAGTCYRTGSGRLLIGCDAGSTDPGPGSACHRHLHVLRCSGQARHRGHDDLRDQGRYGSAGTSGSDAGLAWMVDIMHEIACEQELDRDEPLASRRAQSDPQVARIDLRRRLSLFAARDRPRPSL
jgi:hypothetical protein